MHKIRNNITVALFVCLALGGGFFLVKNNQASSDKIQVTASFYPLYFFAGHIGGNSATVTNITPAGAEPHDYEPTAQDIARIEDSDLLLVNGVGLEPWLENIKQNIQEDHPLIIEISKNLSTQDMQEDQKNVTDPHVWLSPLLAQKIVDQIVKEFSKIDPSGADYYQKNADDLHTRLQSLDSNYRQGLTHCASYNIITSHNAFGYLASAYGLNQIPISGLSPDGEPSPKQLADIAKFAKNNNIKYIFFESLVSPKLANTIATEVGATTLVLDPLEGISNDEIKEGQNYFTKMEQNLANLKIALQCQ